MERADFGSILASVAKRSRAKREGSFWTAPNRAHPALGRVVRRRTIFAPIATGGRESAKFATGARRRERQSCALNSTPAEPLKPTPTDKRAKRGDGKRERFPGFHCPRGCQPARSGLTFGENMGRTVNGRF